MNIQDLVLNFAHFRNPNTYNIDTTHLIYMRPSTRAQPYIIGMILGYILWKTKNKKFIISWVTQ